MDVIFLGTGTSQGVPPIACNDPVCLSNDPKDKRLRSSILIKGDFGNIIIDTSTDFRTQILREKITYIDAVFYTHEHIDHTGGLDDIRPLIYNQGIIKEMPVFASQNVINHIKKAFYYIFEEKQYPGAPKIKLNLIVSNEPFYFNNEKITVIEGLHGDIPVFGYRIKKFAYLTDFSFIPNNQYHKLENLDVLVINCIRKEKKHFSHFILEDVIEIVKILSPKKCFLTHISYRLGFHEEVSKYLPENIFLSYDGLILQDLN